MSELKRLVGAGLVILLAGIIGLGGWTALGLGGDVCWFGCSPSRPRPRSRSAK